MMKAAFTEWRGQIAPVFVLAQILLLVEKEASDDLKERFIDMPFDSLEAMVAFLIEQRVGLLICGAPPYQLHALAEASGIEVHPFVTGEIKDVVDAWIHGGLDQLSYSAPEGQRYRSQPKQREKQEGKQ